MNSIIVIYSAVIGAFAFRLGGRLREYEPITRFKFGYPSNHHTIEFILPNNNGTGKGKATVTKDVGIDIKESQLTIADVHCNPVSLNACSSVSILEITAGDKAIPEIEANDIIRLLCLSENDKGNTPFVSRWKGPDL